MKKFDYIDEAGILAKAVLSPKAKKNLVEARILGANAHKKLYFFFESASSVNAFLQNKEQIKAKLRVQYKKKLALYKQMDFIFYDIDAKTSDEIKHRSKEEEETLERGIAKIYALLDKKAA